MPKIQNIRKFTGSLALFLVLFLGGGDVAAQGNIRLGRLSVTPSLRNEFKYDSNVFYEVEAKEDYYNILRPSLLLQYTGTTPGNYFQAGYDGSWAWYVDFTDNNWQRHSPWFDAGYESPKGWYLKLGANFNWSEDPFGSFNEFEQSNRFGLGAKTRRWNLLVPLVAGFHFSNIWYSEISYRHYAIRYNLDKDKWQDRIERGFGGTIFRRLTPKTSVLVQVQYRDTEYDQQNDVIFDAGLNAHWSSENSQDHRLLNVLTGLRFEPGGKLSGELKLGYGKKEFQNAFDPLTRPYIDNETWISQTILTYAPFARTTLYLNFQRSQLGSPDPDAASFVNTLVMLSIEQALRYRLYLFAGGLFNNDDYQDENPGIPKKYFNRYGANIGFRWAFKPWLSLGLTYRFTEQVVSNEAFYGSSEYIKHEAAFTIAASY